MRRLLVLSMIACIPSSLVLAAMHPVTGTQATWRAEIVNDQVIPHRELVVTGWHPSDGSSQPPPLVLLAPGRGMPASAYSQIAQYLAANGYAVVAVDSPGSGRQAFADGREVPPDPALAPPPGLMAGPYIEVDRFFAAAADAGALDLRFVLDRLETAGADGKTLAASRIDTQSVGLLGHSLGGRIAGALAAVDDRAVAWVGVEGLAPRAARRNGLGVPALAILGSGIWPYAIDNVRELAWCARQPTYFAKMDGFSHNTIVDRTDAVRAHVDVSSDQHRLRETILRFFDSHIKGSGSETIEWPDGVTLESSISPSGEHPPGFTCSD